MSGFRRGALLAAVGLFATVIFVIDLYTPHGVAEWVLYLPLPLAAVWLNHRGQLLAISGSCSALIVIGFFLSPVGITYEWAVGNRVMALLALWLMTSASLAIVRHSQRLYDLADNLRRENASRVLTEQSLRKSEERWRLAMHGGGLGTRDVDLRTNQEVWSETQFCILGYKPSPTGEATSDMWTDRVHADDRWRILAAKEQAKRERSLYHLEYRICRPNQPRSVWVEVFGRYHYDEGGEAVRFVGVCFDITKRKDLERELLEVTAQQQLDIGQELHDGVGQELTGLGLMAQSLTQRLPEYSPERSVSARLVTGLDRVHQQVRELSRGIMPVHLHANGLSAALAEMAARLTEESDVEVTSECPESVQLPDTTTATQMFRVAQEAVSNALLHGKPGRVQVSLHTDANDLRLRIQDDGIGMQNGIDSANGLGLRIMRYRAGLIGGTIHFDTPADGGTVVTFTLPWSHRNGQEELG